MTNESTCIFCDLRDRSSLFIAGGGGGGGGGGGAEDFREEQF